MYLARFLKCFQGLKINQSRLWYQNLMQVEVYFEQKTQSNIYYDQADSLRKVLPNIIVFLLIKVYVKLGCND